MKRVVFCIACLILIVSGLGSPARAQQLSDRLLAEGVERLAGDVGRFGDPVRGAIAFHRPELNCAKCHAAGANGRRLGPDLAEKRDASIGKIVQSILNPSAEIREGFETTVLLMDDGQQVSGIIVDETDNELLLDRIEEPTVPLRIARETIEDRKLSAVSTMPESLANQLADRTEFLDLVSYLDAIARGGSAREAQLKPTSANAGIPPLPAYESQIDHRGMIASFGQEMFEQGEEVFRLRCASCHGDMTSEGSMPTSLRFVSGKFKRGSDPFSMYNTLTHGFGMMIPQRWMVPRQKYAVIHYIREQFLKTSNPSQYFPVDGQYLAGLPAGNTFGPDPVETTPWTMMDYGPSLMNTIEVGNDGSNIAQKGIAIRLDEGPGGVESGSHWMMYDHDTMRVAGAWTGEFIDYNGIHFNGVHGRHPRVAGVVHLQNPTGPGWGNPDDGSFEDERFIGRDNKRYGPTAREWLQYRGMYRFGRRTILQYTVGESEILESPELQFAGAATVFVRTLNIGSRSRELVMQVANDSGGFSGDGRFMTSPSLMVTARTSEGCVPEAAWASTEGGNLRLKIGPGPSPLSLQVMIIARKDHNESTESLTEWIDGLPPPGDLGPLTQGGPANWNEVLETKIITGEERGAFAIDVLDYPAENPWHCRMRSTGIDFIPGTDSAVVCTWDGSVWRVDGITRTKPNAGLRWRRMAAGLFQPLGIKLREGVIYVTCRDQLVALHDLNGDGEADWYECINNDHQVTEHFHEFAMGLQTDAEGNFYYAKSARHALPALVAHHGTLLKVSADGQRTEIIANGFRAANGVCLNPDGSFVVTDQEGHWNPKNRINWVTPGGFYGNMFGYHNVTDKSDDAMIPPMCWITNSFDRSPAELLWVDSERWGTLRGSLLNFSYGYGKIYIAPHEEIDGQKQGGMCALDLPQFPTGIMRGRFHPDDGQLYSCGMFAWSGTQEQPGGVYRIRHTGRPAHLPVGLRANEAGMDIEFSDPVDAGSASDTDNFVIQAWDLKRTANYGSDHYNQRRWEVSESCLLEDGKTVRLTIPDISPTWGMEIVYSIKTDDGRPLQNKIHNTIHKLKPVDANVDRIGPGD